MPADLPTQRQGAAGANLFNVLEFFFRQSTAKLRTATIAQVVACTNTGGVSAVGYVDLQPLVQQTDSAGNVVAQPVIYNCPYVRLQGGVNAVILDPQVGDLGIVVLGDRDLSKVKTTKAAGAPGSDRRHSIADALYLGGILNGVPTQYIEFSAAGIKLSSPTAVIIDAPLMHILHALQVDGASALGATVTSAGHDISASHKHTGVQSGSSISGPPQ
jgi:hypothetical protein